MMSDAFVIRNDNHVPKRMYHRWLPMLNITNIILLIWSVKVSFRFSFVFLQNEDAHFVTGHFCYYFCDWTFEKLFDVHGYFASMSRHKVHARYLWRPEEGIGLAGTGVRDGCELPWVWRGGGIKPGSLQDQTMLLTSEPSVQPLCTIFFLFIFFFFFFSFWWCLFQTWNLPSKLGCWVPGTCLFLPLQQRCQELSTSFLLHPFLTLAWGLILGLHACTLSIFTNRATPWA